ncbi:MAG: undecaprenyl-phosphate glucose phosphotransferase [bacterium]|nr:undecaprenyl-phosphate glucose phosphotransferase [bacterium]
MVFTVILIIADILVVFGTAIGAFHSRFSGLLPLIYGEPAIEPYIIAVLVSLPIWVLVLRGAGLYDQYKYRFSFEALNKMFWAVLISAAIVMAAGFVYRGFSYSRMVLVIWAISAFFSLGISRLLITKIRKWLLHRGVGEKRVLFVGLTSGAADLARRIRNDKETEYFLIGYVKGSGVNEVDLDIAPELGGINDLNRLIKDNRISTVFFGPGLGDETLLDSVMQCDLLDVEVKIIPSTIELVATRMLSDDTLGIPVLTLPQLRLKGINLIVKRLFDLSATVCGLILLAPFLLFVALLIKLTSSGPVLYEQERVGLDGKRFTMYKFRSMVADAEKETGPVFAQHDDPRNTPIGKILRRYSIDEFPQLLNVLNGTMSLVGPRPERPHFVEKFSGSIPRYMERHKALSGMTGWAQVNGLRGNTSIAERVKYDLYYVENWSILFDVRIILKTIMNIILGK